ncbi:MAG: thiamine-phosphate kinase [Thermoplasmata archaeon]
MTAPRRRPKDRTFSERDFHAWLAEHLAAGREGPLPLGDDAAAVPSPRGRVAVLTTDSLVEGTHFLPGSPPALVGRAAVAVSLSDLAAKGAEPVGVLLTLLLPRRTSARWAHAVTRGAEATARRYGAKIIGGDTKPSTHRAVVSTMIGWGRARYLAPRHRARPGDALYLTGSVGRGGAAWARLRATRGGSPTNKTLRALLDVRPRVREGIALAPRAHAMLDTSDGLAESARLLARSSRVRVVLEAETIPWDRALGPPRPKARAWRSIAFFGGDYELLLAASPHEQRRIGRYAHRVGRVERGGGAVLELEGRTIRLPPGGWQPFAARRSGRGAFGGPLDARQ